MSPTARSPALAMLGAGMLMSGAAADRLSETALPAGFVDVEAVVPGVYAELPYLSADNFVGARIDGYHAHRVILSVEAAGALQRVQTELRGLGLALKIFDAYRPQRAVDHFIRWAKDLQDTRTKRDFYPEVDKQDLFANGYIARRSSHSRGSTLDVTLIDPATGLELDMGSHFDFFGPESWSGYASLTFRQRENRRLLRAIMQKHGFQPYPQEWWHFTLTPEPYPHTYFDFPVE